MGMDNPKNDVVPMILRGRMYDLDEKVGETRFKETFIISLRHVESPEGAALAFDYIFNGADWLFTQSIIININGVENIKLEAHELDRETETSTYSNNVDCVEKGYFIITKELLKKICDAEDLDVCVNGKSRRIEFENEDKSGKNGILRFRFLCRVFYSELYEDNTYDEWINSIASKSKSGCFIATAAMGDYNHPIVMDLRLFRDNWLNERQWGKNFIKWYYENGPVVANLISKSVLLKKMTFILIVKPLHLITKKIM
jgi:hypothetical protein